MTHRKSCIQWSQWIHDFQDVIIYYRYFPRIFLMENWLSKTIFKNNIYSEKSENKYMLIVEKKYSRGRRELFSRLTRKRGSFKTWAQTLDMDPDPKKPGLWKTWTLKHLDLEKPRPWKTLKQLDPEIWLEDHIVWLINTGHLLRRDL